MKHDTMTAEMNTIENMITDLKNASLLRWNYENFIYNVTDHRKVVSPLQASVISSASPVVTMSFHSNDISILPLPKDNVVKLMGLGVGVDFLPKSICKSLYRNQNLPWILQ
jgi:hypothetical protein